MDENVDKLASLNIFQRRYMTRMKTQILYSVVTLAECMQDPATLAWLVHAEVPLPEVIPLGRYPTLLKSGTSLIIRRHQGGLSGVVIRLGGNRDQPERCLLGDVGGSGILWR